MSSTVQDKDQADKLKHFAAIAGISVAIGLCALKLVGAAITDSLAVLSSMIDSLSDILGSCITLIAIKFSARPASCTHRYGYGKAEALSALAQAAFVAGSGLFVMYDGFRRLFYPRQIEEAGFGLVIMIISIIATLGLIYFQRLVAKKTNSQAILAESAHYVVDLLTNSSIILSLIVVKFFDAAWFDTITALIISLYLLHNAYDLAKTAVNTLLDRELGDDIRNDIKSIATSSPSIHGIHDLRTRDLGGIYIFEFHLELDGRSPLSEAHRHSEEIENKIKSKYPHSQIIIHQDPAGISEERLDNKIDRTRKRTKKTN